MNAHHIKLIDNTYSIEESMEVLSTLIQDKINFLKQKNFSVEEKTGKSSPVMIKRASELKSELAELDRFLTQFEGEEIAVNIGCTIAVSVEFKSQSHPEN